MKSLGNIGRLIVWIAIIVLINVIANYYHGYIDLTEEKRYTLSESTEKVVDKLDDVIYINVLLDGEFPAGFKRLQQATRDLLEDFQDINNYIEFTFEDPSEGSAEEVQARRDQLKKDGIIPTNLQFFNGDEYIQKGIYPYALITYNSRFSAVNLLQEQAPGMDDEQVLNRSIELLEYKFANIFQKLLSDERKNVVFTAGQGELKVQNTIRLERHLRQYYNTGRINLDSVTVLEKAIDLLIVAGPRETFSDQDKFKVDQYLMNGGKIMWLIDKMDVTLDSISKHQFYVPDEHKLDLDDQLFKYGVRILPNFVLDLESTRISQITGQQGGKAQQTMLQWYYHVLAQGDNNHSVVKNLDRVLVKFPSSIDTLKTKTGVRFTPLLTSSPYSRYQMSPTRLNFEILKTSPDVNQFNKGKQLIAVLMEGEFPSLYENRVPEAFKKTLRELGQEFKPVSPPTQQIVVADSDFMRNEVNYRDNSAEPIGFDIWERQVFPGNKDFVLNCIEYLLDENGILDSRAKEVKLRLLDAVKTKKEKGYWQFLNIGAPIIFLLLFGLGFYYLRRRKYRS